MVENVDLEFTDLVLSVRRIDDNIQKGKIMDIKVEMFEK